MHFVCLKIPFYIMSIIQILFNSRYLIFGVVVFKTCSKMFYYFYYNLKPAVNIYKQISISIVNLNIPVWPPLSLICEYGKTFFYCKSRSFDKLYSKLQVRIFYSFWDVSINEWVIFSWYIHRFYFMQPMVTL